MTQPEHKIETDPAASGKIGQTQLATQNPSHTREAAPQRPNSQPTEPSISQRPQLPKPIVEITRTDHQRRRLALGVAACQVLREMDRDL